MGHLLEQPYRLLNLRSAVLLRFTVIFQNRWDFFRICRQWAICLKQLYCRFTIWIEQTWHVQKRRCIAITSKILNKKNYFFFILNICFSFRSPKLILQELGMTPNNFEFDVSMIVIQMVAFKVLAFLLLQRRLKKSWMS